MRSGSGKNRCAGMVKRGKRALQASQMPDEEQKRGFVVGGNILTQKHS